MMHVPLSQEDRRVREVLDRLVYIIVVSALIPTFLLFELVVSRNVVAEDDSFAFKIHLLFVFYLVHNVVGNLIFGFLTNTSVEQRIVAHQDYTDWIICLDYNSIKPPHTWLCKICNLCILKWNHRCLYFATCIGYHNYRYFFFFIVYLFISMVYALVYNVIYLYTTIRWERTIAAKVLVPLICILFDETLESFYFSMTAIDLIVLGLTTMLLSSHVPSVLSGRTSREGGGGLREYHRGWARRLADVFGIRWRVAWISPLIASPLPGDGTDCGPKLR